VTTEPVILMTDPRWFDVAYDINPWMRPDLWRADPAAKGLAARRAFDSLAKALRDAGARIELTAGAPGLPDMVFPANAAVVLDRRALLSRFQPAERQGEEPAFLAAFQGLQARGLVDDVAQLPPGLFQEGAGDCIWDTRRGWFWAGYGQRSLRAAATAVGDCFGREVVALELASPRFYHLDTCFCPLSGGEVLYYPPAFTSAALAEIRARVPAEQLIAADDEDAAGLCVNAVSLGDRIVMARAPTRLRRRLETHGYQVREVDLAPFILAGGAAFCMTLRLDLASAPAAADIQQEPSHV
jgi:N-dimethylarginine dimethylaminohydrolase